jgi:hypothetical protein
VEDWAYPPQIDVGMPQLGRCMQVDAIFSRFFPRVSLSCTTVEPLGAENIEFVVQPLLVKSKSKVSDCMMHGGLVPKLQMARPIPPPS